MHGQKQGRRCQHWFNALHVYCWLRDVGFDKKTAMLFAKNWEAVSQFFLYEKEDNMARKELLMGTIAILIVIGYIAVVFFILVHPEREKSELVILTVSTLSAGFYGVFNYFFGSSRGSRIKDEIAFMQSEKKTPPQ